MYDINSQALECSRGISEPEQQCEVLMVALVCIKQALLLVAVMDLDEMVGIGKIEFGEELPPLQVGEDGGGDGQ